MIPALQQLQLGPGTNHSCLWLRFPTSIWTGGGSSSGRGGNTLLHYQGVRSRSEILPLITCLYSAPVRRSEGSRLKAFTAAEVIRNLVSDQDWVALNIPKHGKGLVCDCWVGGLLQNLAQKLVPKDESSWWLSVLLAERRARGC